MTIAVVQAPPTTINFNIPTSGGFTLNIVGPSGYWAGKTFRCMIGSAFVDPQVVSNTLTLTLTAAQIALLGGTSTFDIFETTNKKLKPIATGIATKSGVGSSSTINLTVNQGALSVTPGIVDTAPGLEIVHRWQTDGTGPFFKQVVNAQAPQSGTLSVVGGRGRITSAADTTAGNHRESFLHSGTMMEDSEITSLWWGADIFDGTVGNPATPQMGHIHRAQMGPTGQWRGIVITNNIVATPPNRINLNIWGFDGTTLALGSNGAAMTYSDSVLNRLISVRTARRFNFGSWINEFQASPAHLWGLQDLEHVALSNFVDTTYNEADIAVGNPNYGVGSFQVTEPTTTSAAALTVEMGIATPLMHRRYWPYWVKSQVFGNTCRVKVWRYLENEPGWGNALNVFSADFAGANIPTPSTTAPVGPGFCGIISAHLRSGRYMEYGDVTFRDLARAA